jgi:hypothetical protein
MQTSLEDSVVVGLDEPIAPIRFRSAGDREEDDGKRQYSEHGDSESTSAQCPTQPAVIVGERLRPTI